MLWLLLSRLQQYLTKATQRRRGLFSVQFEGAVHCIRGSSRCRRQSLTSLLPSGSRSRMLVLSLLSFYSLWLPTPWDGAAHIVACISHRVEPNVKIPSQAYPEVIADPVRLTINISYHTESFSRLLMNNAACRNLPRQQLNACRTQCLTT